MTDVLHSIVASLDGRDDEIFPFIPHILQDLWEIGSNPATISDMMKRHQLAAGDPTHVLDLGCGKGAVSIRLAREFPTVRILGIDAMEPFIQDATRYAEEYGVTDRCRFRIGDIRTEVPQLTNFDVVILGSIGPVFGTVGRTLLALRKCLKNNGTIILDDCYIPDTSPDQVGNYEKRAMIVKQFQQSGFEIAEEWFCGEASIKDSNEAMYTAIENRCKELIAHHPEKTELFEGYLRAQIEENEVLECEVIGVTWLLKYRELM
ncbi:MAG: SAM-dependent methyltransferase [Candidatus Zhuqueibacterota bacterium]